MLWNTSLGVLLGSSVWHLFGWGFRRSQPFCALRAGLDAGNYHTYAMSMRKPRQPNSVFGVTYFHDLPFVAGGCRWSLSLHPCNESLLGI